MAVPYGALVINIMRREKLVTDKQVLKKLTINKLRGVKGLEISFEGSPVTGIFGLNGCGKTTILQTIMCLYRAKNSENTKMSRFFKYTSTANKWIGSSYSAIMDYRQISGHRKHQISNKVINYSKPSSEWTPRQASKPDRNVVYISLSDSIPDIEKVSGDRVTFKPLEGDILDNEISKAATEVMGVRYENLKVSKINKLDCFTVDRDGVSCHTLNLGAGEQKVFRILQRLYRAPAYSLFVIDEIDLTLHTAALRRLIHIMVYEAQKTDRQLQIVFTSHRQELMKDAEFNVRYIMNTPAQTFCLENPSEDCYEELSGESEKYLKIYVEDDIAKAIITKCMQECEMSKHFVVCKFGSITNSVRLALGISCQYDDVSKMDDTVFFVDGDVDDYTEEQKIKNQIEKTLSGGEDFLQDRRTKVLQLMKHFCPQVIDERKQHPEEFIHEALNSIDINKCKYPEIIKDSKGILTVADHHDYVRLLLKKGYILRDIIELVSTTNLWSDYVKDVKDWIEERKRVHYVYRA